MTFEEFYATARSSEDLAKDTGLDLGEEIYRGVILDHDVAIIMNVKTQLWRAHWWHETYETPYIEDAALWVYTRLLAEGLV